MKDIFGFWATSRQYFDDQARDFLRVLRTQSESSTYGYSHLELQTASKPYVVPTLPDYYSGNDQSTMHGSMSGTGEALRSRIMKEQALYKAQQRRVDLASG